MCQIVLRGLLLPDNKYQTNAAGNTSTKPSSTDVSVDEAPTGAATLSRLDSLRLSDASGHTSKKGSVPIQLLSPSEMNTDNQSVKPKRGNGSKLSSLAMLNSSKPVPQTKPADKPKLYSLSDLNITTSNNAVNAYTQVNTPKKPAGVSVSNVSFVESSDKTMDKLGIAIEKIRNWDRKIGALNTELQKQNDLKANSGNIDPAKLMTRTKQVKDARTAAVIARDDAIRAYTDAINELKTQFGSSGIESTSAKNYKTSYDQMEKMFKETDEKDQTTMSKVVDFMKNSMTKENFSLALSYLNPFNGSNTP